MKFSLTVKGCKEGYLRKFVQTSDLYAIGTKLVEYVRKEIDVPKLDENLICSTCEVDNTLEKRFILTYDDVKDIPCFYYKSSAELLLPEYHFHDDSINDILEKKIIVTRNSSTDEIENVLIKWQYKENAKDLFLTLLAQGEYIGTNNTYKLKGGK